MSSLRMYKSNKSRKCLGTDQDPTRVCPVEFDAHIELSVGSATELQPLPHRQPLLCGGQGEVINLVSCGKGREGTAVSGQSIVLLRLNPLYTYSVPPSQVPFSRTIKFTYTIEQKVAILNGTLEQIFVFILPTTYQQQPQCREET